MATPHRPTRSLKHEYELFVEQEIENYKESVPRSVLLCIGDDAVASLSAAPQFALTELLLATLPPGLRYVAPATREAHRRTATPGTLGAEAG